MSKDKKERKDLLPGIERAEVYIHKSPAEEPVDCAEADRIELAFTEDTAFPMVSLYVDNQYESALTIEEQKAMYLKAADELRGWTLAPIGFGEESAPVIHRDGISVSDILLLQGKDVDDVIKLKENGLL